MLARSSKILHPNGGELKTPLLIKSFSSKGFRFTKKSQSDPKSEIREILEATKEVLNDPILLSAYDLKYYLPIKDIKRNLNPEFLFIDSGGYETLEGHDLSEVYQYPILHSKVTPWDQKQHIEVLNSIPKTFSTILISYDNGSERKLSIKSQISRAEKLFKGYPNSLHDILIKTSNGLTIDIEEFKKSAASLKPFHIIGLTEKELGISIMDRMINIKTIRKYLDSIDIKAPLHIFGSLDPITTVLYFFAGAEIFDGLTWLRYGYHNGMCVYRENFNVAKNRMNEKDSSNKFVSYYDNVSYLNNLQGEMKSFLHRYNNGEKEAAFDSFLHNKDHLRTCFNHFVSK